MHVLEELFEFLRTTSDQESAEVLRRIRTGANPEAILGQIKEGNLLMQLVLMPQARRVYEPSHLSDVSD